MKDSAVCVKSRKKDEISFDDKVYFMLSYFFESILNMD